MDTAALLPVIGSIYDCAVDAALWPSALERISAALDSPAATLTVLDAATGAERTLVHAGVSDTDQALHRERHRGRDLLAHSMLLRPIDEPATSDDPVPEAEVFGSRIYREWAAPHGFRHVMLTTLIRSRARLAVLGVTRRHDQPRYGPEDKALMALLAPHVRRAVTIADLIDREGPERDDLTGVLDALTTAVLVVGAEGRLVHANAAGAALLARGDLFAARGGALDPWDRVRAPDLRAAIEGSGGMLSLARRCGGHAVVSALPLGAGRRPAVGGERTALFVQEEARGPHAVEALGRSYRLTGAELRVLLGLAEGETPKAIAARYGIAASTVRSHLKSLFAKTGAGRQSDLVKLILSAPPVGPRGAAGTP